MKNRPLRTAFCFLTVNAIFTISPFVIAVAALFPTALIAQNNCVCVTCGRACNAIASQGHIKGYSCYVDPASSSGSGLSLPVGGGQSFEQMMTTTIATTIMQNLLDNIFSSPEPAPGKSPEQLRAEQEQRNKEIQAQIKIWNEQRDKVAAELKGRPAASGYFGTKGSNPSGQLELKTIPKTRPLPIMGSAPLTADEMERQAFLKKHGPNYIEQADLFGLKPIPSDRAIKSEESGRSLGAAVLRTALGQVEGLEGIIAGYEVNIADASLNNLKQAVGCLVRGDDAGALKLGNELLGEGKVVNEANIASLADAATGALTDHALSGGQDYVKNSYKNKEVARVVEEGRMGIAPLKEILQNSRNGIEASDNIYKGSKLLIDYWDNKNPGE